MKLLFVTDNGFSFKNKKYYYSGANVQHYSTATQYFEDIVFIAKNNPYDMSSFEISPNYKTYLVDPLPFNISFIRKYSKLNSIIEKEIKDADMVMCFGLNGYLAYKKAKKYNKPIIAYIGGCIYDTLINMDSKYKQKLAPIMMKLMRDMAREADYVHYVDKYLLDRYPTKGKYLICPSARIEVPADIKEKRRIKIDSDKSKITLGIIGYTHNKIKGIDTIIKALPLLGEDYVLQVVGRGDHTWLDEMAKELNVHNQVKFLGVLKGREEVFKWLDDIDIYLQPSLTEGMPRATLEAMSRACPVISTGVGGLNSIVSENYRISVGDYVTLAEKVTSLSKNKYLLMKRAEHSFDTARRYEARVLDKIREEFYIKILK